MRQHFSSDIMRQHLSKEHASAFFKWQQLICITVDKNRYFSKIEHFKEAILCISSNTNVHFYVISYDILVRWERPVAFREFVDLGRRILPEKHLSVNAGIARRELSKLSNNPLRQRGQFLVHFIGSSSLEYLEKHGVEKSETR